MPTQYYETSASPIGSLRDIRGKSRRPYNFVVVLSAEPGSILRPGEPGVATHCPYCSLQCAMTLVPGEVDSPPAAGPPSLAVASRDFPTNRGGLCKKGWTAAELLDSSQRLRAPLMRHARNEPLLPTTWVEAIERIARAFSTVQAAHGRDAVGIFGGGGLTNETAYMLGKFARVVLRTKNIDYNGRFCMASAASASQKAFGIDRGLPFPLADLARAGVIMLVGANPAETMPPAMQHFEEQRSRGGMLIVADPRRTATAAAAGLHLQLAPGTDAALANGLLNVALRERLIDRDFIERRTTGFEAVKHVVASYWPDRTERITGVPAGMIIKAARKLGEAATGFILTARGAEQQIHGVQNVLSFINLALALGKVGRPFCGFGCVTGQANGQGGREHGQKSDQLPGYRRLDNPAHREHIARVWGVAESELPGPGPSACELIESIGRAGGVRSMLVMGSNLVVSAPNALAVEARLAALDFLVVVDPFLSDTAELADVVLPSCQWAEEEGTITSLEGRLLYRCAARAPPDGVHSDLTILRRIAAALGAEKHVNDDPETVFDELRRASAGGVADYAGMSYGRIRRGEALFWPCPSEAHPGTPRLFLDRFATDDGRARFHPVEHAGPSEHPDDAYPLYLTTGRLLSHYQSGTQTRRVPSLVAAEPEPFVEIHPQIAKRYGVADGDLVRLRTRRGEATLRARYSLAVRLDTVFVPFHWSGRGRANNLTTDALDPYSKIPEFKIAAVALEKLGGPE
jgi:assimilatory nitrate reductase catalytic subunit